MIQNDKIARKAFLVRVTGVGMAEKHRGKPHLSAAGTRTTASHLAVRAGVVISLGLLLANCASQAPVQRRSQSKEVGAFSDPKYGKASPRVVDLDQDAPKGGGRYHVGNPYRVAGKTYVPSERAVGHTQAGLASWYGEAFHGRKTANGEIYDRRSVTAAHPTMPLPSYARVTNMRNGHSIVVRVNDRGPFHGGRVMDVSERVANALNFKHQGTTRVKIDYLGKAGIGGSDDIKLMASLRTDGQPANSPGAGTVMVASAGPVAQPNASLRRDTPVLSFSERSQPRISPAPLGNESPASVAASAPVRTAPLTPAPGIPGPPDRPFDLGTIPGASTPVRADGVIPPVRPRLASLSYAPETGTISRFQQGNPLAKLPSSRFEKQARTKVQAGAQL